MLQPAYKEWASVGTHSSVDGRAGGCALHLYTETAPVHVQGMEWSTGGPAGYLETSVCKGLCVTAHIVDEQKVPKCVPTYVLLWACLADSSCAGAPTQCICPRWCGPAVWPLEAGEAAGCGHLQLFPQLQCDAITFLLLWSLRHQRSSLAGQIITEDPECS